MSTEKTKSFQEAWQDLIAASNEALSQIKLTTQCQMRRFYLVRHEDSDPDKISGTGVIFEDGMVAMRWKTRWKSTAIYDNIKDLLAIHGHSGKTELKFIDVEKAGA